MKKKLLFVLMLYLLIAIHSEAAVVMSSDMVIYSSTQKLTSSMDELYMEFGRPTIKTVSNLKYKAIAYLDPVKIYYHCTESNYSQTSNGCMRWYVFATTKNNYTMILDHNITARAKWNDSNKNYDIENTNSNAKKILDELVTNSHWQLYPRLITAQEVATITGKSGFNASSTSTWWYLNSNNQSRPTYNSSTRSNYDWLINYTYQCKTGSVDFGCTTEDNATYTGYGTAGSGTISGFWTQTPVGTAGSGANMWIVDNNGRLYYSASNVGNYGIRPVIDVPKSLINY